MPPANEQAFTGFGGLPDTSSEWNRLNFAVRSVMNQMATTTLVTVKAVRAEGAGFVVDVQPMVAQLDGAGNAVPHGTIHGMPVWRVQGGTGAVIVKPAVGDIGVAVFASTDISGVKRSGAPTTPGSSRRFDWADGIYLGGVLNAAPTQFVRMDDAGVTITSTSAVVVNAPSGATVNGNATINGNGTITGNGQINGNLNVAGNISGNFT